MSVLAVAPVQSPLVERRPTLDDLIVGAWEGLSVREEVACPVCDGELVPGRICRPMVAPRWRAVRGLWQHSLLTRRPVEAAPSVCWAVQAEQSRRESTFEESPDITGQGGR